MNTIEKDDVENIIRDNKIMKLYESEFAVIIYFIVSLFKWFMKSFFRSIS